MSDPLEHPIADTLGAVDDALDWFSTRLGLPHDAASGPPGEWVCCAAVDARFVARWERELDARLSGTLGRSHPQTCSGYVLDWYAGVPARLGGMAFALGHRVPRLDRHALAFHLHAEHRFPTGVAVLDPRFWCLPDDPAAGHTDATVVPDADALDAVLRAQVKAHADDFLADYSSGARLPRRQRLGAFLDALDSGLRMGAESRGIAGDEATSASPRRTTCCYYFKVSGGAVCSTCPRLVETERVSALPAAAEG